MAQDEQGNQRRRYSRKRVEMLALTKVGTIHQGRGLTKDISLKGILIENRMILAHIRPNRIPELLNSQVRLSFPQEALTVTGKVVRIDHAQGNIGIEIVSTTNDQAWEKLCAEEQKNQPK